MKWKIFGVITIGILLLIGSYFYFKGDSKITNIDEQKQEGLTKYVSPFETTYFSNTSENSEFYVGNGGINIQSGSSSLTIHLPTATGATDNSDGSITVNYPDYTGVYYMNNTDEFEWEIHVGSAPPTNCIAYPYETTNIILYQQQALNIEVPNPSSEGYDSCNATDCWNETSGEAIHRNQDIIDSYALYNEEGKKVYHLKRILVTHSKGSNWLTQTFNATHYEICGFNSIQNGAKNLIIDPTFGYTSVGASYLYFGYYFRANGFVNNIPSDARGQYIENITFYIYDTDGSDSDIVFGLYNDSGANPAYLIQGQSSGMTIPAAASEEWFTTSEAFTGTAIDPGQDLYFGWLSSRSPTSSLWSRYDTVTGPAHKSTASYTSTSYPTLPTDATGFTWATNANRRLSLYANYSSGELCDGSTCYLYYDKDDADVRICELGFEESCQAGDFGFQIKFDISDINDTICSASSTIQNANLTMYIYNVVGYGSNLDDDFTALLVEDQTWGETTTTSTLNSQTTSNSYTGTMTSVTDETLTVFNVTTALKAACDNGYTNFTVRIYDPDQAVTAVQGVADSALGFGDNTIFPSSINDYFQFEDREEYYQSKRPRLFVDYTTTTPPSSPTYSENSTNSTYAGQFIEHGLKWQDDTALSGYIFSFDNGTGSFVNDSFIEFTGTINWSNVTKGVNTGVGETIRWQVYANDSDNNMNSSDIYSYVTTLFADIIAPVFTSIPADANLEYGQSLNVDFDATDETGFGSFFINDTTNFQINSTGGLYNITNLVTGGYQINVSINDTSGNTNSTIYNITVAEMSDTTPPTISMNIIDWDPTLWWYNQTYFNNIDNLWLDFKPYTVQCIFDDPEGIEFAALDNNESFGTFQYGYTFGVENYSNYSGGSLPTHVELTHIVARDEISGWYDLYDFYSWNCYAYNANNHDDVLYNSDHNITIEMNITPEIYFVHRIDTESYGLDTHYFNITQDFTNYDPGNHTWNAFFNDTTGTTPADFRSYTDDFGQTYKMTWNDMTTLLYWHMTDPYNLGKNPIATKFTKNDTYAEQIALYNDDVEFHFHNHQFYNYTNYSTTGQTPALPAEYWNQVKFFNNFTCLGNPQNESDNTTCITSQDNMEQVFAQRIIDEQDYPSVYTSGWGWEDNNLSLWLEGTIKYDTSALSAGLENDDVLQPIENVYNWTGNAGGIAFAGYHPNSSNYKDAGNMSRVVHLAFGGAMTDELWNEAFAEALNKGRVMVVKYDHNYGADPMIIPNRAYTNYLTWQNTRSSTGNSLVKVHFSGVHEAFKALEKCNDDIAPSIQVYQLGDIVYIESNEELFAAPYLALEHSDGSYSRGNVEVNGTNKWKFNTTNQDVIIFSAGAQDLCGNSVVQTETFENYTNIVAPTTSNIEIVTNGGNATINFTATLNYEYVTSNVYVQNVSIDGTECNVINHGAYIGSDLWQTNCTVNENLYGFHNVTIFVNFTDNPTELSDTEINALYISPANTCTYPGSGTWYVACSDNCTPEATNLNGNPLIIYGNSGTFTFNNAINGWSYFQWEYGCQIRKLNTFSMFW